MHVIAIDPDGFADRLLNGDGWRLTRPIHMT